MTGPATISPAVTESSSPSTAATRPWRRTAALWLAALAVYWVTLFAGTHTRARDIPSTVWDYDKLLHAGAYGVLATLVLIAWRRVGGSPGLRGRLIAGALVLAYGALDELTQPFFDRQCELLDWIADAAGVGLAIAVDQWRHRLDRS